MGVMFVLLAFPLRHFGLVCAAVEFTLQRKEEVKMANVKDKQQSRNNLIHLEIITCWVNIIF